MNEKPFVFVGSSSASRVIAETVAELLDSDAHVTPWTVAFELSATSIENLERELSKADFGVFVMTPEDLVFIKNEQHLAVRDNVVFELGLFMGQLGRGRCFMIVPKEPGVGAQVEVKTHLPTDLAGITYATYDAGWPDGIPAILVPACNKIKRQMGRVGRRSVVKVAESVVAPPPVQAVTRRALTDEDYVSMLETWLGMRPESENLHVIFFDKVDEELGVPLGTSGRLLERAGLQYRYRPIRKTDNSIKFERFSDAGSAPAVVQPQASWLRRR